jgi:hypothetical protein
VCEVLAVGAELSQPGPRPRPPPRRPPPCRAGPTGTLARSTTRPRRPGRRVEPDRAGARGRTGRFHQHGAPGRSRWGQRRAGRWIAADADIPSVSSTWVQRPSAGSGAKTVPSRGVRTPGPGQPDRLRRDVDPDRGESGEGEDEPTRTSAQVEGRTDAAGDDRGHRRLGQTVPAAYRQPTAPTVVTVYQPAGVGPVPQSAAAGVHRSGPDAAGHRRIPGRRSTFHRRHGCGSGSQPRSRKASRVRSPVGAVDIGTASSAAACLGRAESAPTTGRPMRDRARRRSGRDGGPSRRAAPGSAVGRPCRPGAPAAPGRRQPRQRGRWRAGHRNRSPAAAGPASRRVRRSARRPPRRRPTARTGPAPRSPRAWRTASRVTSSAAAAIRAACSGWPAGRGGVCPVALQAAVGEARAWFRHRW